MSFGNKREHKNKFPDPSHGDLKRAILAIELLASEPIVLELHNAVERGEIMDPRLVEASTLLDALFVAVHAFDPENKCYDKHQKQRQAVLDEVNARIGDYPL